MVGSVIGAVAGPVIGGLMGGSASSDAANAQSASADAATAEQRRQYDQTRKDQMPFLSVGTGANRQLAYLMGINPVDINGEQNGTQTPSTGSLANPGQNLLPAGETPSAPVNIGGGAAGQGVFITGKQGNSYILSDGRVVPFGVSASHSLPIGAPFAASGATTIPSTPSAPTAPATTGTPQSFVDSTYSNVNKAQGDFGSLGKAFGASDFQADPGYDFRMSEGQKALERSAAAKGGLMSGAALKDITRFGQDTASAEYQNAYNRYNTNQTNLYNRLAGISGTGQTSANTLANVGQSTANQIGENMMGSGNAQAAGMVGQANAWNTGLSNAAGGLGSFYTNYQNAGADVGNYFNNTAGIF